MHNLNPSLYHDDWIVPLRSKLTIQPGRIETLESNTYNLASMFFVAESITSSRDKFSALCRQVITSLKPNGHLVGVFMENSTGYTVSGINFPAVPIDKKLLRKTFAPLLLNLSLSHLDPGFIPLRQGFTGILVLTGQKKVAS